MNKENNLPPWQQNTGNNEYRPQTNDNPSGAPVKQPEISKGSPVPPENPDTEEVKNF